MKIFPALLLSGLALSCSPLAFSQVYQPKPKAESQSSPFGSPANAPASNQSADSNQQNTQTNQTQSQNNGNNANQQENKTLFGNELPFLNPHDETITLNGQNFAIADNRVLSARFEKYLNEPEESFKESSEYHKTLTAILKMLDPNKQDPKTLTKVAALLTKAASYPGDAGVCDTLAQVIYTSVLSKKGANGKQSAISALEDEERRLVNRMQLAESLPMDKRGGDNQAMLAEKRSSPVYLHYARRVAEIQALKKRYEGENSLSSVEAKIQFQSALLHLFFQRRFQHVRIGSRVYNRIFKDGDTKLRVEKDSKAAEIFGKDLGMPPTISMLDSLSSEAIREAEQYIKSVDYLVDQKELVSAGKRLSEAFLLGEFTEAVATFPREKKRRIQGVMRSCYRLLSAMDAKDYGEAERLVNDLNDKASDFDGAKARSGIAAFTLASNAHLFKAKEAMIARNQDLANEEIQKAIEIWPRNPKLNDIGDMLNASSDMTVARNDFERHLREKNFRQIYQEQYRFAPAIQGNPELEDAFKQVISNIALIETAIAKATEFSKLGQDYAAWEELRSMRDNPTFSQDPQLGKQLEDLTARVSDLTKPLDQARRLEEAGETGSALAWYLKARQAYPNSKFAKDGIDRIVAKVL